MQEEQLTPQKEFEDALSKEKNSKRNWAIQREIPPPTLYTVLRQWGSRRDRPLGGISRDIMQKISDYVIQQNTETKGNDHEPTSN